MNEPINVVVEEVNKVLVTTSNRVAEELGVNHRDLLDKIDGYLEKFQSAESSAGFYIPSNYQDSRNRTYRNYLITEKGVAQLIGGYSAAVSKAFNLNVAYINEFHRMREALQQKAPRTLKEALILALEQQEKLEALELENQVKDQQIAELKPKATYYDLVLQCPDLLSMTQIAKDYGMSAKGMNKKLHELGVQFNQSGVWFLYAKYQDKGYTKTKTQNYNKPDGTQGVSTHMYWTQKGRLFLYDLLKSIGIVPMIERSAA